MSGQRSGVRRLLGNAFLWVIDGLAGIVRVAIEYVQLFARYSDRYVRLMRLHRPIGIWLLLWPTLWALWVASDGQPTIDMFAIFVGGTILMRSAGCVFNDLADRNLDGSVERTAERPLATGEVEPPEAILLFAGLMLIAFGMVMQLNTRTIWLAVGGAALTMIYPFMKRFISAPQLVLGLAFAWGVPMAFTATTGTVSRTGWLIYLLAIIWVLIYDTQYAMADREDDLKVGIRSTAILFGEMDRVIIGALQATLIGGLLLLGDDLDFGGAYHTAIAIAALLALRQQFLIRNRDPGGCEDAFINNFWFGGTVFFGIAFDYVFTAAAAAAAAVAVAP